MMLALTLALTVTLTSSIQLRRTIGGFTVSDRVTMADVARKVGVSVMTVSRVVNNKGDVSEETRQRVLDAIQQLGYRPSAIARSLATRRTGTLGLVIPDVANPFFAEVARGVEHVAYAEGYNVFLCNTDEDPRRELDILESLEEKRVDGIVLCSSRLENGHLRAVAESHEAVVLVNRRLEIDENPVAAVLVDDVAGGGIATRHLLSRGHSAIGFLSGPPGSRSGRGRVQGYRQSLRKAGIAIKPGWLRACAPVAEAGRQAAHALLGAHPEITGLLCYNDLVAVGALKACSARGCSVPDDLAVVGFDDIPLAELVTPALTTCRIPRHELGVRAVRLLLEQIEGSMDGHKEIVLHPSLVVRASAP
jgi:LacI family transcriptional regulator